MRFLYEQVKHENQFRGKFVQANHKKTVLHTFKK